MSILKLSVAMLNYRAESNENAVRFMKDLKSDICGWKGKVSSFHLIAFHYFNNVKASRGKRANDMIEIKVMKYMRNVI